MKRFLNKLGYALSGLFLLTKTERHFQFHTVALIFVCFTAWLFQITRFECILLILASALVLVSEAVNTAIERLSDAYTLEKNPIIKQVKDIAAGSVLIAVMAAIIIGIIVFYPYFQRLFH